MEKIEFFRHNIDEEDISRVSDVLRSIFLTNAGVTKSFEEKFEKYLSVEHVIAVNSCTAALHLSLLALDIGEGDEVITTPMSFIATSNAVLHAGATPVFVDVEPVYGNIDPSQVEAAITPKTKAILPVHLYGNMVDMRALRTIADRHALYLIEDAAHCIEGERDGVRVGELGDTACFSFYATKNITSGEGGAISCHTEEMAEKLKRLRLHGMSKDAASRHGGSYKHWDMVDLGWKYNTTDIQSALLIGQLEKIEDRHARRYQIARRYAEAFDNAGIEYIGAAEGMKSACHLFTVLVEERDRVITEMNANGIGVAVNYNPIHLTSYYRDRYGYKEGGFPVAESIGRRTISLPLFPLMRDDEVEYVIKALIGALNR